MPPVAADDVIVINSSSSSEGGGEGCGRSTSSARPALHPAAAAPGVGGKNRDGVKKKKKGKEREEEAGAVPSGEGRRVGQESGQERKPKAKTVKKKKKEEEEKGRRAAFASAYAGDAVPPGGEAARLPLVFALLASPVKRPVAGGEGGGGNGGKGTDRVRKEKRKEREEGKSTVAGGEVREVGEERKAKKKKKNKEKEKEKNAGCPSHHAGDVLANGVKSGHPPLTCSSPTNPAKRLVADREGGGGNGGGGKNMDGLRKKKREDMEVETSAVAGGKVRGKGEKRKIKDKKKEKNKEEKEKTAATPSSYAGDVVATSDEIGRPSPTCSFPMRRVKRLIVGSEDGGGNGSKGSVRTSLDAVFLINKASEFFLELFSRDAYVHATHEHKKAIFYKHLSSTVCEGKRYEFLSDFVPEKVRAEDALKALAEQP